MFDMPHPGLQFMPNAQLLPHPPSGSRKDLVPVALLALENFPRNIILARYSGSVGVSPCRYADMPTIVSLILP